MPIKIPDNLPAVKTLESENIFVMTENRAIHQDIRPLRIAVLNLMPIKIEAETQLIRLLSNSPLQVEIDLLKTASHVSKNTPAEHLFTFYKTFYDVMNKRFDGLIITGAPIEHLRYGDVTYWNEFCKIIDWANKNVYSTLYICWAAQAGLYYKYGVKNYMLDEKLSGIYSHHITNKLSPLVRGFDDVFYVPHSRYTEVREDDISKIDALEVLAKSDKAGVHIVVDRNCRNIFVTGHSEYSRMTLANEYIRDKEHGLNPKIPENYFKNDNPSNAPCMTWKSHANLLFTNWLNHIVYQHTPYDLSELI